MDDQPPEYEGDEPGPGPAAIMIGPDEHRVNDEAIAALRRDADLYARGDRLVRIIPAHEVMENGITDPVGATISKVTPATLREKLTKGIQWFQMNEKIKAVAARPPGWSVQAILDRGQWDGIRPLTQVIEYPVMLPDGSFLTAEGYHASTGLYYAPRCPVSLSMPDRPTRDNARAAAAVLTDMVADFPFHRRHHRSAWLAALLTPLARFAFKGPTPMFLMDANAPGSGKGLLVDLIGIIAQGKGLAVSTLPDEGDEFRKLVTSLLMRGCPLVVFDDLGGKLGSRELNSLLTSTEWADRVLGESREVQVPNFTTWFGTGNNVAVLGDTLRRICPIRLETPHERPEERTDIKVADLRGWAGAERPRLLSAAMTMLRGFHIAGRPDAGLPPWMSYENWSALIRGAIVWCDLPDPWEGRQALRESHGDERIGALASLMDLWDEIDVVGRGLTCADIVHRIDGMSQNDGLGETLMALVGGRTQEGKPDKRPTSLGYIFRQFDGRNIRGRSLGQAGKTRRGMKLWTVSSAGDAGHDGDTSSLRASQTSQFSEVYTAGNISGIPGIPSTKGDGLDALRG